MIALAKQTTIGLQEAGLVRAVCKESFFEFVREFWSVVIPEDPVWNWHIPYLCYELQQIAERVMRGEKKAYDLVTNISPGTTKSTIFSQMFPAWVWTRMPSARFICASYTDRLALVLSQKCRDIVMSDKYMACFPDVVLRDDQNTKGHFATTKNGMRYSVGAGGSVIGMHAHFIIIDDPLDPTAAVSEEELINVNRWMTETLPTRMVSRSLSTMILVMQRLHQNDPAGHIIDKAKEGKRNIKHIKLPAEIIHTLKATDDAEQVLPKFLRHRYVDDLFDAKRLTREVLDETAETLLEFGYACQFLQRPIPRGGGMFDVDQLLIQRPPEDKKFKRIIRYWDKAATRKGGCFTVGLKMGLDMNDRYCVLDVIRGQWGPTPREALIKSTAQLDGHHVTVGQEVEPAGSGKEAAATTTRNLAGFMIHNDRPTGDKELRAVPFADQVGAGNVYLAPGHWNAAYMAELQYFPYSTYRDQVDASSGAFNWLITGRRRVGAM
jgi:predicted phage terminase large subunit-like protein